MAPHGKRTQDAGWPIERDALIDEIRAARHRISERFGHNTKALCDHYREMEKKHPDRMLRDRTEVTSPKSGE